MVVRVQRLGPPQVCLSFLPTTAGPYFPQEQIGLEAVGQFIQYLLADLRGLQSLLVAPERLSQRDAQVHSFGMLGQQGAEFADRPWEQIAPEVEPGQCTVGELDTLELNAISPAVEVT